MLNKADLGLHPAWRAESPTPTTLVLSCTTGEGIDDLSASIYERITGGQVVWNPSAAAINARHQDCLRRVRGSVEAATAALRAGQSPEFIALDLWQALDAVGEVVGGVDTEEILGRIFSTFCIGK